MSCEASTILTAVFKLNGSQTHMLQFVCVLFESVIKLLHHHQALAQPWKTLWGNREKI